MNPSIEQAAGEAGSDALGALLRVALNDDGTLQGSAVQSALGGSLAAPAGAAAVISSDNGSLNLSAAGALTLNTVDNGYKLRLSHADAVGALAASYTRGNGVASGTYGIGSFGTVLSTDTASPLTLLYSPFKSTVTVGDGTHAAVGTTWGAGFQVAVVNNGNTGNEHAGVFASVNDNSSATPGRLWLTDFNVHGPIALQPNLLQGISVFANNYYNGQPSAQPSIGLAISTQAGTGGGTDAAHNAATTYPLSVGLQIMGKSTGGTTRGYDTGLQIGGSGGGWNIAGSRVGTGLHIRDFDGNAIVIDNRITGNASADIVATSLASTDQLLGAFVGAEANPRLRMFHDGTIRNGVGGSTAPTQVLGLRRTGWTAWTGTATRTTVATGSATLQNVAEALKALLDDLTAHGLIGA